LRVTRTTALGAGWEARAERKKTAPRGMISRRGSITIDQVGY